MKRTANTSAPATPSRVVASVQPTSIDSPVATRDGPLDDADDAQVEGAAGRGRDGDDVTDREVEPLGEADREDRRATGIERRERRAAVAGDEGQPAVGVEVRAGRPRRHRCGCPATATSNMPIGLTRATPGHRVEDVVGDAFVGGARGGSRSGRGRPG